MGIKGIDVSTHNGNIDWKKVRESGIDFAIIRAGYGKSSDQVDAQFENNYKGCKQNDIKCGFYWYSYAASKQEANQEALTFIKTIKNKTPEYPVYIDIEDKVQQSLSKKDCTDIVKTFCDNMEDAGYYAGIYSYKSFLENKLFPETLKRYTVWLAHINIDKTNYTYPYDIWQYSHTGCIDGVKSDVDLNIGYKDFSNIIKNNGYNGFKKTENQIKKGSVVRLIKDADSYSGESLAGFVYNRDHVVSEINGKRAVITFDGIVVAAVNTDDLILIS